MYNPFTIDDNQDIMNLSAALRAVDFEVNYNHMEEDEMTEPKKVLKKVTPAVAPVKAKAPVAKEPVKAAPVKAAAKAKNNLKPRQVPEGHLGVNDLAKELGVDAAAVRRKLRSIEGLTKPEGGLWAWKENSKDLGTIRKAFASK